MATRVPEIPGMGRRLDTSEKSPVYLLTTPGGGYARVSATAYHIMEQRSAGVSFDHLAQTLSAHQGRTVSPEEVEAAYCGVVARIEAIDSRSGRLGFGLWVKRRLIPEGVVSAVAQRLAWVFDPRVAVPVGLGVAISWFIGIQVGLRGTFAASSLGWAYLLFLVSLLIHEFGHASACVRFGARPSDIGIALYLIYPVFYSDVSAAWQLKRGQRVAVDLGGVYLQCVVGTAYYWAFFWTDWEPLRVAVLMVVGSCVFSLNPIFKFDGYWVVSDALGVTDLSSQPGRMLLHLYARLRGQARKRQPWPAAVTGVLAVYSLFAVAVWGLFVWHVVPLLADKLAALPEAARDLARSGLDAGQTPNWERLRSLAVSAYFGLLFLLLGMRLLARLSGVWRWLGTARRLGGGRQKPARADPS